MLVLAVDTSTPAVTAGVVDLDDAARVTTLLVECRVTDTFGHAELLMPLLRQALDEADVGLADASAVVVGVGPGPFTGLRVGIATAAALGDALGVPVHPVASHEAFAAGLDDVLVVTDARRREVHVSVYADGSRTAGPAAVAPAAVPAWLAAAGAAPLVLTGAAASLLAGILDLDVATPAVATSTGLVSVAADALIAGRAPEPLRPLYLRRPDATEPSRPKNVLPVPP